MLFPRTIFRYLSLDLWRLVLLTAGVVVAVACFAIAIKPLADGRLGPVETLKFMLLAAVPMLQYALPFAGGFAATLVYHRFAQDNEATACSAGGVSYRAMLAPAMLTAVVVAGLLAVLIDQAMPRLLRNMDKLVAGDLARLLESSVKRGESVKLPDSNRFLYADGFFVLDPKDSGADQHFALSGLVIAEMEDADKRPRDGKPRDTVAWEASARLAYVWLYQEDASVDPDSGDVTPGSTTLVMQLRDSVGGKQSRGQVEQTELVYTFPSRFTEDPKYLTWTQMDEAYAQPETLSGIDRRRRRVAARLAERLTADDLRAELRRTGRLELVDAGGSTVVVRAADIGAVPDAKGFALLPPRAGGVVEITTVLDDGRTRLHRARRAFLSRAAAQESERTILSLRMEQVQVSGAGRRETDPDAPPLPGAAPDDAGGVRESYTLQNLSPARDALTDLLALNLPELLKRVNARLAGEKTVNAEDPLRKEARGLERSTAGMRREIVSKQHERVATVLVSLLTVLCGAVVALRLKGSLPLPVYLWSFMPAVIAMLLINGGQKVTSDSGLGGLALLYSGVVALAVLVFVEYRRLARH